MKTNFSSTYKFCVVIALFFSFALNVNAQYKQFRVSANGDTLNAIDKKGMKQGKWVVTVPPLRGEPGYDDEGVYKNDKKEGMWRKYTTEGDIIAIENYRFGGKDGVQQYFTFLGELEHEEEWHSYNPDAPYDTISIYGTGNNEIIDYKIVKAEQYSVPNGEWRYYGPGGAIIKVQHYDRGHLMTEDSDKPATASTTPADTAKKAPAKTQEMLDYEKKYSKKKRKEMERTGETNL